jgi:uncharacterized protein YbjT (DUF2867 family)
MRVALIGGTGLIGSLLAPKLLAAGHELHLIQRRAGAGEGATLHVAPPADWPALVRRIAPEAAISTLGSTMKQAGSQAAFRAVDHDLVLAFAAAARAAGATRMATVSSVGADPASKTFYLRIKGETDAALEALGFPRLDIFRPGLLRGARGGERRRGERLAILASPLVNLVLQGPLDRFAAIDAEHVAAAIAASLTGPASGLRRYQNRQIRAAATGR